jgi:iron-sulfur cluster insertion protein
MSGLEPIHISDAAVHKVKTLLQDEENKNSNLKLRVYITGGGCSGFSYGFKFDEEIKEDDTVVDRDGVLMVVDALSIQYLMGATVDYSEGLKGARFTIDNPMAASTCGCGSSFSL